MKQWITMLLVTFLFTTASFASSSIAIVKQVQGDVTVKHNGKISRIIQGDELNEGDTLITGKNSYVGVIFHDGSILSLKENSFLQVKNFVFQPIEQTFNFKLFLKKGTALFESGKIGTLSPEDFSLEVPAGTIGIRGTKFLVEVN